MRQETSDLPSLSSAELTSRKLDLLMEMHQTRGIEGMPSLADAIRSVGDKYLREMGQHQRFGKSQETSGENNRKKPLDIILIVLGPPGIGKSYLIDELILPCLRICTEFARRYFGIENAEVDHKKWDTIERRVLGPDIESGVIDMNQPTSLVDLMRVEEAIESDVGQWLQASHGGRILLIEIPAGTTEVTLLTAIPDVVTNVDTRPHAINILDKLLAGKLKILYEDKEEIFHFSRKELFLAVIGIAGSMYLQVLDDDRDQIMRFAKNLEEAQEMRIAMGLPEFETEEAFIEATKAGSQDVIRRTAIVAGAAMPHIPGVDRLPEYMQRVLIGGEDISRQLTEETPQEEMKFIRHAQIVAQRIQANVFDVMMNDILLRLGIELMKQKILTGEADVTTIVKNEPIPPASFFG